MFRKILVANRGEIAVRIIRACREMGIAAVAIYSEADRDALHVRLADEAYCCGPARASESYLNVGRVLDIALQCGVEAIHPGYGFLSENGDFAESCRDRGLAFIGPSADVIRTMGDKVRARQAAERAGVATVPGTNERLSDEETLVRANEIGFPVMVKATAGGGGKGLRRVRDADELRKALARARGEALSSFGDDGLYLEKYLDAPRHVEVQILADGHGEVIHLFERECSLQRRHQKLLEEAPACDLDPECRAKMARAAVVLAKAVRYTGAGTCEFLVDARGEFYFLEMNTRLQVEHAVTEEVTGVDLVQAMIRIAAGAPLGLTQDDLSVRGHAMEARIYAEDPDRGFAPSPGTLHVYRPADGVGVRVDGGVQQGDVVSTHYDPLLAKLIVWGADRKECLARLRRAVDEFAVGGIKTSLAFHRRVSRQPDFVNGRYDTTFVDTRLRDPDPLDGAERTLAAALAALAEWQAAGAEVAPTSWRVSERKGEAWIVSLTGREDSSYEISVGSERLVLDIESAAPGVRSVIRDGLQTEVAIEVAIRRGVRVVEIAVHGRRIQLEVQPEVQPSPYVRGAKVV